MRNIKDLLFAMGVLLIAIGIAALVIFTGEAKPTYPIYVHDTITKTTVER